MGRTPRLAAVVLVAATVAGCGARAESERVPLKAPAPAAATTKPVAPHLKLPAPVALPRAAAHPRPPLPEPRTVRRALRRALLAGHLTQAQHDAYRRAYRDARRTADRLTGTRRAELLSALEQVRAMARARRLTASRMPQAFLILRRNAWFWTHAALPAPHFRTTFGRDPLIFQYYPGQGMQLQPLASFGRANALAGVCLDRAAHRHATARCRPRALRRLLDGLVTLAAPRGGIPAWEAWFAFGGARPGWVSGMTQGTAIEALTRGARVLHRPAYLALARRAVRLFVHAPPLGVAVRAPGGRHYVMYSTLPSLRILNGHLQAITGLRDLAIATGDATAVRAYRRGERAARSELRDGDTGAWSLYSSGGAESSLSYHELTKTFLGNLCGRTHRAVYCAGERRFARYLREPPRVGLHMPTRLRLGRALRLSFTLSKISDVTVSVTDRRGLELRRVIRASRGAHRLAFVPRRPGRVRVIVRARGLSGPVGRAAGTLKLRRPPKKHRHHRHRRAARA